MAKFIDLTGQRFGRLTVAKVDEINKNGSYTWKCECECGKKTIVSSPNLRRGITKSCGCLRKETSKKTMRVKTIRSNNKNKIGGTMIKFIKDGRKINSNNKTGINGVGLYGSTGKYRAYINVRKKFYHLGFFDDLEDAIKARKLAEEKLFHPIIEEYKEMEEKECLKN